MSPNDVNLAPIKDEVKISVKCRENFFNWDFLCCSNNEELSSDLGFEALLQVEAQGFFPQYAFS